MALVVVLSMCVRAVNLSRLLLPTENIEQDGRSQRVPNETDFAIKVGISFSKEVVYPI